MRTIDQINEIKSRIIDPYSIENFLDQNQINYLIKIFDDNQDKLIRKKTGPVALPLKQFFSDPVIHIVLKKIEQFIGSFEINYAFFFKTSTPHIIHNDDSFDLPSNINKAIVLPLKLYGDFLDYPKLCFFEQFYFHGPAKFFLNESDLPTHYNRQVYDYSDVDGTTTKPFDEDLYELYFTHLKKTWLTGLSFQSCLPWVPGSAIVFDSTRLHCASDFRKNKVDAKLAISIFTKIV